MITNTFFCGVFYFFIMTLCSRKFVQDLTDLSVIYKVVIGNIKLPNTDTFSLNTDTFSLNTHTTFQVNLESLKFNIGLHHYNKI